MKSSKALHLVVCLFLALGVTASAQAGIARGDRSPARADRAFVGSQAEFVAMVLPRVLARAGHDLRSLRPDVPLSLQAAFGGSEDFVWSDTFALSAGPLTYTLTLPADLKVLEQGTVALGILRDGRLYKAYRLTLQDTTDGMRAEILTPQGDQAATLSFDKQGHITSDASEIAMFFADWVPPATTGTVIDALIEIMEMIKNMLYQIKNVINTAICIIYEAIEYFEDLNGCGFDVITPGGGAIINAIVCSIESTIEFIEELAGSCA